MVLSDNPGFSRGETFLREGERVQRLVYAKPPPVRWTDERSSLVPVFQAFGVNQDGMTLEPVQLSTTPVAAPAEP